MCFWILTQTFAWVLFVLFCCCCFCSSLLPDITGMINWALKNALKILPWITWRYFKLPLMYLWACHGLGKGRAELKCLVQGGIYNVPPDKSTQAYMLSLMAHVPGHWQFQVTVAKMINNIFLVMFMTVLLTTNTLQKYNHSLKVSKVCGWTKGSLWCPDITAMAAWA